MSAVPVYAGPFGKEQAERLLWRAGFGARAGEAEALAQLGLAAAVKSLTEPASTQLVGPAPHDEAGKPLAPQTAPGHDHLWWLDRMVRTTAPLVERMTLLWHSWFATSNRGVGSQTLMLNQNQLFRQHALGSFADLITGVTEDPAMLVWLNGNRSVKSHPNENYGRELMELFTLGANRGAYTETDVREIARALTGWRGSVTGAATAPFSYDPRQHDAGPKTIFGQTGSYSWQDACNLCLNHPLHSSFFVWKLWNYFVPVRYDAATLHGLQALYSGHQVKPVVEAILMHPSFYDGPRMIKPPVVFNAGLLRAQGRGIDTTAWWSLGESAGQRLFYPPDVGGWDAKHWLDTATFRARFLIAALVQGTAKPTDSPSDPTQLVTRSLRFWGLPTVTPETQAQLTAFATAQLAQKSPPSLVETAVRRLIASSPDLQTA